MSTTTPIIQTRQMVRHFKQFRELPDAEMKPEDPSFVERLCNGFAWELDYYQEMDNSPDDYDPRPGHVLLSVDEHCDGASQVSFQNGGKQEASLSRLYLDEPTGGFFEEHFILADEKFHLLRVSPQDNLCLLGAYHWNKMKPDVAQRQHLELGTPSLGGPLIQHD